MISSYECPPIHSDQERLARIGALLARAISRKHHRKELEKAQVHQADITNEADPIVIFIGQKGEVSPQEVKDHFSLSRSTTFRRLNTLVKAGRLQKTGHTRCRRYRLC